MEANSGANAFIHLGDGAVEAKAAAKKYGENRVLYVSGNCDLGTRTSDEGIMEIGGRTIFFTHGDRYHVKSGIDRLLDEARLRGADIVLYGHTHEAICDYENGIYVMNPGSLTFPRCGGPSYGIIDLDENFVRMKLMEV